MEIKRTKKLMLSAMFIAIGIVLPFFTAQIETIGEMLLPMHIPALLCGFICGWRHGLVVGILLPVLRSVLFSRPPMFPDAVYMALELASYGVITGLLYKGKQGIGRVYISLVVAMICGRMVWGTAKAALLGMAGKSFTLAMFISGAVLEAIPGIILQLVLIPAIMSALKYSKNKKEKTNDKVSVQK